MSEAIDPVATIRDELKLNITMMAMTFARTYQHIKHLSPSDDNILYDLLLTAAADDLLKPHADHEGAARAAGWAEGSIPGILNKGTPPTEAATSWVEAAVGLDVPEYPIRQVYVVSENLFAQLSLLEGEQLSELGGHRVWANWRDGPKTVAFFEKLFNDRSTMVWGAAIEKRKQRHRSVYETDAQEAAADKWEKNSS